MNEPTVVIVAGGENGSPGAGPPSAPGETPPAPDATALAEAVAVGAAAGEVAGRAEAMAADAATREQEQRTRAETAESQLATVTAERDQARQSVVTLELELNTIKNPPVAAETVVTVTDVPKPDGKGPTPATKSGRGWISKMFHGA